MEKKHPETTHDPDDDIPLFDLQKLKDWFRSKTSQNKSEPKNKNSHSKPRDEDDEIGIDFSKVRSLFSKSEKRETLDDEISLDWETLKKTGARWGPLLLILIPFFLSMFFRLQPSSLPLTDIWAQQAVENFVKNNLQGQIEREYPYLPDANKQAIVEEKYRETIRENEKEYQEQIEQASSYFKSRLQDESGHTYLAELDPYFWLRYANNIVDHGHMGDIIKGGTPPEEHIGEPWDTHMNAPKGREMMHDYFHPYLEAYMIMSVSFFAPQLKPEHIVFYLPVILSALAVIPAFFIAKKASGNFGGFIAAIIVAIHQSFLSRTFAGFSDTDPYNVVFPLFIAWAILEALEQTERKRSLLYAALGGILTGIYSIAWTGWWYIFDFTVITLAAVVAIECGRAWWKNSPILSFKPNHKTTRVIGVSTAYILVTTIAVIQLVGLPDYMASVFGPLTFITFKQVGVQSVWPNVYTTVSEQMGTTIEYIVTQLGGSLIFGISILGVAATLVKKDEEEERHYTLAILLAIWFAGTIYAALKGARFSLLVIPAFSIAFGVCFGVIHRTVHRWMSKEFAIPTFYSGGVLALMLLLVVGFSPLPPFCTHGLCGQSWEVAINAIPSINDAWVSALTKIKEKSEPNAIINSWWDFGHWFKFFGDRATTFDGTSQNTPMAHWIGKALLTDNEEESVGILRMLDCGSNDAFVTLDKDLNNPAHTIDVLNKIQRQGKESARATLQVEGLKQEAVESVLNKTHCDPPQNYFITSDDMVLKSNVWGHFGAWNFWKAAMYNAVIGKEVKEGTSILTQKFNVSEAQAEKLYYEIATQDANEWIAPWPRFTTEISSCTTRNTTVVCQNGLTVDLTTFNATFGNRNPYSLVYATLEGVKEKVFPSAALPDQSAILIPGNKGEFGSITANPEMARSMFVKLYFFRGHGQRHFELFEEQREFSGVHLFVWNVSWSGSEQIIHPSFLESARIDFEEIVVCHKETNGCQRNLTRQEAMAVAANISVESSSNTARFSDIAKKHGVVMRLWKNSTSSDVPSTPWSAALNLGIGNVSSVIESEEGFHIIHITKRVEPITIARLALAQLQNKSTNTSKQANSKYPAIRNNTK